MRMRGKSRLVDSACSGGRNPREAEIQRKSYFFATLEEFPEFHWEVVWTGRGGNPDFSYYLCTSDARRSVEDSTAPCRGQRHYARRTWPSWDWGFRSSRKSYGDMEPLSWSCDAHWSASRGEMLGTAKKTEPTTATTRTTTTAETSILPRTVSRAPRLPPPAVPRARSVATITQTQTRTQQDPHQGRPRNQSTQGHAELATLFLWPKKEKC